MSRNPERSAPLSLWMHSVAAGRLALMTCRACREPLDLHQPNASQPEQFLATCGDCGAWYRVEVRPGDGRAQVVRLPEVSEVRPPSPPEPHPG